MDITGMSHDKEKFLYEDCNHVHAPQNNNILRAKRVNLYSFICAIVSVLACIFACLCAVYCHRVLVEIRAHHNFNEAKHGISASGINSKMEVSNNNNNVLEDFNDADNQELDDFDTDKHETEEFEDYMVDNTQLLSTGELFADGTGESVRFGEKKQSRMRRGTKEEIKACRRNCKGKGQEKKKCRKACKKNTAPVQRIKIHTQIDLPAAHFEANMKDVAAQTLVATQYNKVKDKGEGPLRIFKQADWVKDSSPVDFSKDSVATTKSSGIFLVYAQAYIGGDEPEKSIIVVQKRNGKEVNALSCDNGVNSGKPSEQMQTCSVFGLMKLDKGDTVEIQRSEVTKGISLDDDKTFFGLVQFSGIKLDE